MMEWKEKLKDDLYFKVNLIMKMMHFHEETNGICIRNGKLTKTFKKWLKNQNIGEILLEEIKRRQKEYDNRERKANN